MISARTKALMVTIIFFFVGLWFWHTSVSEWQIALPLLLFYLILLINTYFSVYFFSEITPQGNATQNSIDSVLAILYIILARYIGIATPFVLSALALFIVATTKYIFLRGTIPYPATLKKKIFADALGAFACVVALGGVLAGYALYSIWALLIAFGVGNFYLFFMWPLYCVSPKDRP